MYKFLWVTIFMCTIIKCDHEEEICDNVELKIARVEVLNNGDGAKREDHFLVLEEYDQNCFNNYFFKNAGVKYIEEKLPNSNIKTLYFIMPVNQEEFDESEISNIAIVSYRVEKNHLIPLSVWIDGTKYRFW